MAIDATQPRFNTGRAVKRATELLKRDPLKLVLWSVVFAGLPDAAMTYVSNHAFRAENAFASPTAWLLLAATALASMLGLVALQAVIARRIASDHGGSRAYSGEAAFGGPSDYLALATLGVVTSLGILAGFILLVIPGIILSLAWIVVTPVMVIERLGVMDSIRRSNSLTGNAKGPIFSLWVATGVIGGGASWLLGLMTKALDISVVTQISGPALQVVVGLINSVLAVAIYQELRWSKEGGPSERLAEVFA